MVAVADYRYSFIVEFVNYCYPIFRHSAFYLRNLLKMLEHLLNNLDIFICPVCRGSLKIEQAQIRCVSCRRSYAVENGIPLLFCGNGQEVPGKDVTGKVKSFYEQNPFPNYEDIENTGDLVQKAESSVFARLLNEQVPCNIRVLEAGCGTGQMSNFLGTGYRLVFGVDMCLNSLALAQNFKERNNLQRVGFYQMNLFRPIFKDESFPLVICNGVLHHTSDPYGAFKSISGLVSRGGYIVIGLYNKWGRLATDLRRGIFNIFGKQLMFLDPRLRQKSLGETKKRIWFMDQYQNPHESKHTIGEVLNWFDESGFEFINSIPKTTLFAAFSEKERLFKLGTRGSALSRFLIQAKFMFSGSREGGLFIMIGRKK